MGFPRRRALLSLAACAAGTLFPPLVRAAPLLPAPKGRRAVVIGGGWGGLAAARHLRELAPDVEVILIERNAAFHSLPLSNRWLADRVDGKLLQGDYRRASAQFGYTFLQAAVTAIDRDRRQVVTAQGVLDYDWLILAAGIREDHGAWFGDDARAAALAREQFGSAWQPGEVAALKARLARFSGGTLVMAVPPLPYRCPPAPYERACMIASLFRQRQLKARIVLLDPNPMMQVFARVFSGQYRDFITYVPQARLKGVDPGARTVQTDFETFRFDEAILMPPQQAGELAWQAGLIARDAAGKPTGWAGIDPTSYRSSADPRIFIVGDMIDRVSTLFGHYPKTGEMALHQGRIAAAQIASEHAGKTVEPSLPASTCYVLTGTDPMEMARLETSYRLRGDGLIMQTLRQHYDAQPRDEDIAWAKGMYASLLG